MTGGSIGNLLAGSIRSTENCGDGAGGETESGIKIRKLDDGYLVPASGSVHAPVAFPHVSGRDNPPHERIGVREAVQSGLLYALVWR